jgi:hypothetical protein
MGSAPAVASLFGFWGYPAGITPEERADEAVVRALLRHWNDSDA